MAGVYVPLGFFAGARNVKVPMKSPDVPEAEDHKPSWGLGLRG